MSGTVYVTSMVVLSQRQGGDLEVGLQMRMLLAERRQLRPQQAQRLDCVASI